MLSWIIFALDIYAYYFINMIGFSYNKVISSVLGVTFAFICFSVVYYAVKSTKSDPTDPTIYRQREADSKG